jgi:hypothetical protein
MLFTKTNRSFISRKLSIVIEKDIHGYFAYCPELKGCHSQGKTFAQGFAISSITILASIIVFIYAMFREKKKKKE